MRYRNRTEAGKRLVDPLRERGFGASGSAAVVLGVPRGGVVVAAPVAGAFDARLGAVAARKLRAPRNPELAIGAVGLSGEAFVDHWLVRRLRVDEQYLETEIDHQRNEVRRRSACYGIDPAALITPDCDVVVVDDGVATGATLIAALRSVRVLEPGRLFCAVPVGPADTLSRLESEVDHLVCPLRPTGFAAVGEWYVDFTQTTDEEVTALLQPRTED
jgi:putative phosphoribosyl transferase